MDGDNVPERALRANQVGEYVAAIGRLFDSQQLRAKLSSNGRAFIEIVTHRHNYQGYTWERVGALYEKVLQI